MTGERKLITGRYYNCNGQACAIVAVVNEGIDWGAYISGVNADYPEEMAVDWVAKHGAKMGKEDAKHFFPDIKLPYRL